MSVMLDNLELPEEMIWLDEAQWSDVEQSTAYALSGALLIDGATKLAGRTMTLGGDNCWAQWSLCKQLIALSNEFGRKMNISLEDGRRYTVMFRHGDGDCVEISRIYERQPRDEDWCRLTLRFLILEEVTA